MNNKRLAIMTNDGRARFFEKYGTVLILLGMIVIMSFLKPEFLTFNNLTNIIRQQTPVIIIALGVTLTIISGGIDVSGGAVVAMCSVIIATFAHPLGDPSGPGVYPLFLTILIGVAAGATCGTLNGLSIAYGNVPPFIATLGMMSAARAIALIVSNGKPINGFTDAFNFIGGGRFLGLPMPIWILALMFVIGYVILHKTKFGVYIYAIGSNETAAKVSGVNVKFKKMLVYTIAGAFAGVAAVVLTSRILAGQPAVGSGYEMDAITGAVIGGASFSGGIGTMAGTIVGTLIMGVLTNGMTMLQIDPSLQMLVKGIVVVGAVLLDERKHRYQK